MALVVVLLGMLGAIAPPPAQAQSILDKLRQLISPPTQTGNTTGRSRGGAIRGNCTTVKPDPIGESNLIALIPNNNLGKTAAAYPTFWFYVPQFSLLSTEASATAVTLVPVTVGEFMLLDDQGQPMLKRPIAVKLPSQAGFSRFTLPNDRSLWLPGRSLEVGKRYNWFFSVVCDTSQPAKNPMVRGWVERVAAPANLKEQLQQVAVDDRYRVYVENRDWYEALTLLAENRETATESWLAVLTQLGLAKTANAPIAVLEPLK